VSQFVGGEYAHRDHHSDPKGRDPFIPVKAGKQRQALEFLQEHVLSDRYFKFPPQLLRRLAADRWSHWGNDNWGSSVDYPLHERVLRIQRVVLDQMLSPSVLRRIQNNALKVNADEQPLQVSEVFRTLTEGVWSEYPVKAGEGKKGKTSVIRRNLQRRHLQDLANLVLGQRSGGRGSFIFIGGGGGAAPPDARSLARMHLREIQGRIGGALKAANNGVDDTTRAHLEECRERIGRVLNASMTAND